MQQKENKKEIEDNTEVIKASDGVEPPKAYELYATELFKAWAYHSILLVSSMNLSYFPS